MMMRRDKALSPLPRNAGFTLVELTVSMTIGLLVMGAAYTMLNTAMRSATFVNQSTTRTRSAGHGVDLISRNAREMVSFIHAEDYSAEFTCDWDNDRRMDDVKFWVDSQKKLNILVKDFTTGQTKYSKVLATNVVNVTDSVPMFGYFRSVGVVAAGDASYSPPRDGDRLTKTAIMRITVLTRETGTTTTQKESTDVFLRNSQS